MRKQSKRLQRTGDHSVVGLSLDFWTAVQLKNGHMCFVVEDQYFQRFLGSAYVYREKKEAARFPESSQFVHRFGCTALS